MFVSNLRKKKTGCQQHNKFSYKHIQICYNGNQICYNEIGSELSVKGGPSPDNTDEQEKVKGETFFGTLSFWGEMLLLVLDKTNQFAHFCTGVELM